MKIMIPKIRPIRYCNPPVSKGNRYCATMTGSLICVTVHSKALDMRQILIVDDQPAFRRQLRSALVAAGLEVAGEAASIREALKLLIVVHPDLAVVDVDLPEISGIHGTVLMKKAFPELRVILVSAYSDQSALFEQAAIQVGAEGFLSKDRLGPEVFRSWFDAA